MKALYEQYRPATWAEVVGQDKALRKVKAIEKRGGFGGKAFWITGKSGTGKTTIGKIIASSHAAAIHTHETTGRGLTATMLQDLVRQWSYMPLEGKGYVLIVNEAHGLSRVVIEPFLNILEDMASGKHGLTTIVFTTTVAGDKLFDEQIDAGPFSSRVHNIMLAQRDLAKAFAAKVREAAVKEGLDGRPISDYVKLADKCKGNMRDMYQLVESGWGLE